MSSALIIVAQLVELCPAEWKVAGSIPGQGSAWAVSLVPGGARAVH